MNEAFTTQQACHTALNTSCIHLWRIHLQKATYLESAHLVLDKKEQARAQRFYFAKHRRRFTLAHAAMRHILSLYIDSSAKNIIWHEQTHGKPELSAAQNPQNITFNLSHSHEMALLAINIEHPIGVDIEITNDKRDHLALAKRYFAPAEYEALMALPNGKQQSAFFHIWTQKEAVIKALGLGLHYPLHNFTVSATPPAKLLSIADDDAEQWLMHSFFPQDHYQASLAIRHTKKNILYRYFHYTAFMKPR